MQNFIAQSMRRFGLAPENKSTPSSVTASRISSVGDAPLSHMEVGSKWSYSTLQYPLDIQSRTDLGHYMMFYVNIPNESSHVNTWLEFVEYMGAGAEGQIIAGKLIGTNLNEDRKLIVSCWLTIPIWIIR